MTASALEDHPSLSTHSQVPSNRPSLYIRIKMKIFKAISVAEDGDRISFFVDISIIALIILNTITAILTSLNLPESIQKPLDYFEIFSVTIFTIEYLLRLWTADLLYPSKGPLIARIRYFFSLMAIIDLAAILPFYLPLLISIDLRSLRMLRIFRLFRLFKINRYTNAIASIWRVLRNKSGQLGSSIFVVSMLMLISSVLMYNVESAAQPEVFKNAFSGFWWAIATLTTVGYGDIYPVTTAGKILSSVIAIFGIGLIAVPTGIISAGFMEEMDSHKNSSSEICEKKYCPYCGKKLD